MTEQDLKQENVDLKKQIEDLKKKLQDRSPAFNGNLLKQSDNEFRRIQEAIGKAITSAIGNDLVGVIQSHKMHLYYDSGTYSGRGWIVYFENEKKIKDSLADIQMKKFQESLDNFAWAVNNQVPS